MIFFSVLCAKQKAGKPDRFPAEQQKIPIRARKRA
jgi:hypothetical protein